MRESRALWPYLQEAVHVVRGDRMFLGPSICSCRVVNARMAAWRRFAMIELALNKSCPPPSRMPVALRRADTRG
eukprot:jgi/Chrpa1/8491/Chrysochromulina_OHIO_Genome00015683-RA